MRLDKPRILPLNNEEFKGDVEAATVPFLPEEHRALNLVRTLGRAPAAMVGFLGWARYFLSPNNSLPPREREIVILRIGHLCDSAYEVAQHAKIGREAGLTPIEFD